MQTEILGEGLQEWDSPLYTDALDQFNRVAELINLDDCLLYTSPSPRDLSTSRMPSSA